jgi:putative transposase
MPEAALNTCPVDWLGVDLGIVKVATTSDGERLTGDRITGLRQRHRRLRKRLQKKATRSALRLLRKRSGKSQSF